MLILLTMKKAQKITANNIIDLLITKAKGQGYKIHFEMSQATNTYGWFFLDIFNNSPDIHNRANYISDCAPTLTSLADCLMEDKRAIAFLAAKFPLN